MCGKEGRNEDDEGYDESWYKQADFDNTTDFLYCQRFSQLVWSNEVLVEEGSDDEGASGRLDPAVRHERRVKAGKCLLAAQFTYEQNRFRWQCGAFHVKPHGKICIRRQGDLESWKHPLKVVQVGRTGCAVEAGSKLPHDVADYEWQLDVLVDKIQAYRICGAVQKYAQSRCSLKRVMDDDRLSDAARATLNTVRSAVDEGDIQGLAAEFNLNAMQVKALTLATSSRVSLTEGPPGTRKTVVGEADKMVISQDACDSWRCKCLQNPRAGAQ